MILHVKAVKRANCIILCNLPATSNFYPTPSKYEGLKAINGRNLMIDLCKDLRLVKMELQNPIEGFINLPNWTKTKTLGVLSIKQPDLWVSAREIHEDLQRMFDYQGTVNAVHMCLKRYHLQSLIHRKTYQGMHTIHRITEKGLKRFLFLSQQYLPSMIAQYRSNPQYYGLHSAKIFSDVSQILQIYTEFLNVDKDRRTSMYGDNIYRDDYSGQIVNEAFKLCADFPDKQKQRQCLRDIKKVRHIMEDQQKAFARKVKAQKAREAEVSQLTDPDRWSAIWEGKL